MQLNIVASSDLIVIRDSSDSNPRFYDLITLYIENMEFPSTSWCCSFSDP